VRETVTEANAAKDSAESALAAEQATEASLTEQVHALSEMSEGYYSQLVQAKHTITQVSHCVMLRMTNPVRGTYYVSFRLNCQMHNVTRGLCSRVGAAAAVYSRVGAAAAVL